MQLLHIVFGGLATALHVQINLPLTKLEGSDCNTTMPADDMAPGLFNGFSAMMANTIEDEDAAPFNNFSGLVGPIGDYDGFASMYPDVGPDVDPPAAAPSDVGPDVDTSAVPPDVGQPDADPAAAPPDVGKDVDAAAVPPDVGQDVDPHAAAPDVGQDVDPKFEIVAWEAGAEPRRLEESEQFLSFLGLSSTLPEVPERKVSQSGVHILTSMLTGPTASDRFRAQAAHAPEKKVRPLSELFASCSIVVQRVRTEKIIGALTETIVASGGSAVLFVECTRGDETPLRARARSAAKVFSHESQICDASLVSITDVHDEDTVKQKIVQTDWEGAVAYSLAGVQRYLVVKFNLLTWLQCVDRGTAECYQYCFSAVRPRFSFAKRFDRHVHVSTTDKDAAIAKAFNRPPGDGCAELRFGCHVHVASSVIGKASNCMKDDISSLVHLTLSLNQPGAMQHFRKLLRKTVAKVKVFVGVPPQQHTEYRQQVLDMLFEGCEATDRVRRSVIDALANGDWTNHRVIEHWSPVATTREAVVHRFQKQFVWAVASSAPHIYPRHRWTGAEITLRWVLTLQSCHGLLDSVYAEWFGKKRDPADPAPPDRPAGGHGADGGPHRGRGADDGGGDDEHAGGNEPPSDLIRHDPNVGNASTNPTDAFHQENTKWRKSAYVWLGHQHMLPNMLIFRRVHEGHRRLLSAYLKMSGIKWERKQLWGAMTKIQQGDFFWDMDNFRVTAAQGGRHSGSKPFAAFCLLERGLDGAQYVRLKRFFGFASFHMLASAV